MAASVGQRVIDTMISFPQEGFGPFNEHVWPKFLYDNAARILKLED